MNSKTILIFAAFLLLSVSAFANTEKDSENNMETVSAFANIGKNSKKNVETVQLTGSVVDDKNKEALAGATIYVDGKKYYSNLDGDFSISDIKPGKYQIKVEFISYKPVVVEIDVNKNEKININLLQS